MEGEIPNYFPHAREDVLEAGYGNAAQPPPRVGVGRRTVRPGSARERTDRRPLDEINPERSAKGLPEFSTNVPLVHANYGIESARSVSQATLARELADLGRPVKAGQEITLGAHDAIYHLGVKDKRYGIREVDPQDVGKSAGGYVALDKRVVDNAFGQATPRRAGSTIGKAFDRATAGFKTLGATPGFMLGTWSVMFRWRTWSSPAACCPATSARRGRR